MYCRECGNVMDKNAAKCPNCGTNRGEGVDFCANCGQHTSEKMEFCKNCGIKLNNVLAQKVKTERIDNLRNQVTFARKLKNVSRFICFISLVAFVVLLVVLFLGKKPDYIPDLPTYSASHVSSTGSLRMYDFYNNNNVNEDVQAYWGRNRKIISKMGDSLFVMLVSFITWRVQNRKHKKLLKKLKEAKNVL